MTKILPERTGKCVLIVISNLFINQIISVIY